MRRKDREIKDFDEIRKIIAKCDTCRLAINDDKYPYIIPLNFGEETVDGTLYLYFHSANAGTKLDLLHKNPNVSFEMDCGHNIILYQERMSCTMGYESVIGHGTVEWVDQDEDKLHALKILMRHFHDEEFPFSTRLMPATTVFRLRVEEITGKRRDNEHPEETVRKYVNLEEQQ